MHVSSLILIKLGDSVFFRNAHKWMDFHKTYAKEWQVDRAWNSTYALEWQVDRAWHSTYAI